MHNAKSSVRRQFAMIAVTVACIAAALVAPVYPRTQWLQHADVHLGAVATDSGPAVNSMETAAANLIPRERLLIETLL